MAARRLLIIMVVLLTISTLAAALVPPPDERSEETTTTTTTAQPTSEERGETSRNTSGRLIRAKIDAGSSEKPARVAVRPGDQLSLVVSSEGSGEISIPDLGLIAYAAPGSPARFDILIEAVGDLEVRGEVDGLIATIVSREEA